MTPNTPAGGAVAWSYEHNYGNGDWHACLDFTKPREVAWNRNIRPLAYADATVPLDAVRGLVPSADEMRAVAENARHEAVQKCMDFDAKTDFIADACRSEVMRRLEALTRGEGND